MEKQKRVRGVNYSNEEKSVLLNLVSEVKHIIENKKTDCTTNKQKEEAWELVTKQFNARAPNNVGRNTESLKKFYDNIKKKTRLDMANQKMESIKTGGGQIIPILDPTHDLALSLMNAKTVVGLENIYDSDQIIMEPPINNEAVIITNMENCTETSSGSTNLASSVNNKEQEIDWGNWSANNLTTPVSKEIKTKKSPWEQRRRPNINDNLQESHINLANAKIELIKLQLKIQQEEYDIKKERDAKEFDLKMKNLELDIQLKEAKLKLIN